MASQFLQSDSNGIEVPRLTTKNPSQLRSENEQIFNEILRLCRGRANKRPVILLIGKTGSGKSSFINTLYKAITGKYHKIARTGIGSASSVTLEFVWYQRCGIEPSYLDEGRQLKLQECLDCLPCIIDFAGLGNVDSEEIKHQLDRLCRGCIEPGTSYKDLLQLQKDYGADILNNKPSADRIVSHVLFVQSWRDAIPVKLIDCLLEVINSTDGFGARKYDIDVRVLLTHYDEICLPGSGLSSQTIQKNIEEYNSVKAEIATKFSISGSTSDYLFDWVNYSDIITAGDDATDGRKEVLDNKSLMLLKDILEPHAPRQRPQRRLLDWRMTARILFRICADYVAHGLDIDNRPVRNVENIIGIEYVLAGIAALVFLFFMFLFSIKP